MTRLGFRLVGQRPSSCRTAGMNMFRQSFQLCHSLAVHCHLPKLVSTNKALILQELYELRDYCCELLYVRCTSRFTGRLGVSTPTIENLFSDSKTNHSLHVESSRPILLKQALTDVRFRPLSKLTIIVSFQAGYLRIDCVDYASCMQLL